LGKAYTYLRASWDGGRAGEFGSDGTETR